MKKYHDKSQAQSMRQRTERQARSSDTASLPRGRSQDVLHLQRAVGNREVGQLLRSKQVTPQGKILRLQRKLTVGAANDQYEQEADQVARQVLSMPDAAAATSMQ